MAAGFAVLRLAPAAFWAMTPRELAAALGAGAGSVRAPDRSRLVALMARYPDGPR